MTYTKRNPLARLWLNDAIGGWSLGEIVGTVALGIVAGYLILGWLA